MEDQSDNSTLPAVIVKSEDETIPGWSKREMKVLLDIEKDGPKPISVSLVGQLFELFLNGYSCIEIAKLNKGLSEGDVLFCRKKFKWDEERDRYAFDLQLQMRQRLAKHELESLEFLVNEAAIIHKERKEQQLKYLQTGKEEDKPKENWANSPGSYGKIIELIQKVTGKDRVTTQHITAETTVKVEDMTAATVLRPELQSKMLKKLSDTTKKTIKAPKGSDEQ